MSDIEKRRILKLIYEKKISALDGKRLLSALKNEANVKKIIPSNEKKNVTNNYNDINEIKESDIAVIGFSGRFPEADDAEQFWENLIKHKNCVREINRWNQKEFYDPTMQDSQKSYSKWGGFLENIDEFDPSFFNLSPKQAELMEPRQRLFLEEAWHTMESAGYNKMKMNGLKCGVFIGCEGSTDYFSNIDKSQAEININYFLGNSNAVLASRFSYFTNMNGPTVTIDTACSSSLCSVHIACESIIAGDCDIAIAGGASIYVNYTGYVLMSGMKALSPTGKCRAFDNNADGFVPGEGVAAVLLKKLSDAVKDGDTIYGIIKGSGMNQDGKTNGITAPNASSQTRLEERIYEKYNINPETIGYVEAHGTGTKLGDPIEVKGLTDSFRKFTDKKGYCAISSVKTNIGHLGAASGVVGLIKILQSFRYEEIPSLIHFEKLNSNIELYQSPFYIAEKNIEWKKDEKRVRRAAISAFGHSGTNCHLVIEEPPKTCNSAKWNGYILLFSAETEYSLREYIKKFTQWLEKASPSISMESIEYTLLCGREKFRYRYALYGKNKEEIITSLNDYIDNLENTVFKECDYGHFEHELMDTLKYNRKNNIYDPDLYSQIVNELECKKDMSFNELYKDTDVHYVLLPGYIFERERYWIPEVIRSENIRIHKSGGIIDENISSFNNQKFKIIFTGNEYFLKDHIIFQKSILPAATYIEIIREAGQKSLLNNANHLKDIVFESSYEFNINNNIVYISLEPEDNDLYKAKIVSPQKVHCTAFLYNNSFWESDIIWNVDKFISEADDVKNGDKLYSLYDLSGYNYGNSFRTIKKIYLKKHEALCYLVLNREFENDELILNPALLDGAFQTVLTICDSDEKSLKGVPYSISELKIYDKIPSECYVYVRKGSNSLNKNRIKKYNISLFDKNGKMVLDIVDFTTVGVEEDNKNKMSIEEILLKVKNGDISAEQADLLLSGCIK